MLLHSNLNVLTLVMGQRQYITLAEGKFISSQMLFV